jgi:acetyl-CoA carboxylase biotin carboxyl carrier protein
LPEAKPTKMSESESLNEQSGVQVDVESQDSQPNRRRRSRSRQIDPSVNMDELRAIIDLIQENDFAEFEIAREGFRLHVRRGATAPEGARSDTEASPVRERDEPSAAGTTPATGSSTAQPGTQAKSAASEDQDLYMIPSPIVGTFYRSASPNADPFVKIGSNVEAETIVCIIEAMKLMNEIQAETSGEVIKIYVENGQPVEYGQPLFGIKR